MTDAGTATTAGVVALCHETVHQRNCKRAGPLHALHGCMFTRLGSVLSTSGVNFHRAIDTRPQRACYVVGVSLKMHTSVAVPSHGRSLCRDAPSKHRPFAACPAHSARRRLIVTAPIIGLAAAAAQPMAAGAMVSASGAYLGACNTGMDACMHAEWIPSSSPGCCLKSCVE